MSHALKKIVIDHLGSANPKPTPIVTLCIKRVRATAWDFNETRHSHNKLIVIICLGIVRQASREKIGSCAHAPGRRVRN
jgi:hypothetical protein